MIKRLYIDWWFVSGFLVLCLAWLPFYVFDWNPRTAGWILAAVAAFGLAVQLVAHFDETPTGQRIGGFILLLTVLVRAWAQRNVGDAIPITWATYAYISITAMCIVFAWHWVRWAHTTDSPLFRERI